MTASTKSYGTPVRTSSGCKVGWYFYATRAEAEAAAETARDEAASKALYGYDFGYSVPGSIDEMGDGTFRVTIP